MRYFHEQLPELAVIAAGSLLEFAPEQFELSMPVGRIEYMFMGPMTFEEFLGALKAKQLLAYLQAYVLGDEIPQAIHEKAMEYLQLYHLLGGMPEVIKLYGETHSLLEADKVKFSILNTYRDDFAKYKTRIDLDKLQGVFDKLGTTVGKRSSTSTYSPSNVVPLPTRYSSCSSMPEYCIVYITQARTICH